MYRLLVILFSSFFVTLSLQANSNTMFAGKNNIEETINENKFHTKQEFFEYCTQVDKEIQKLPDLGMLWAVRGLSYLFDYKFQDGIVKADLKKAQYYFAKALEHNYLNALYPYAIALHRQGKDAKALEAIESSLKPMSKDKNLNEKIKSLYIQLSNLYSGILLDGNYDASQYKKAISYGFPAAYRYKNKLAQLEIGLIYKKIGLEKQSNYFIAEGCKETDKKSFVYKFCKNNIQISRKKCKACILKKYFNMQ